MILEWFDQIIVVMINLLHSSEHSPVIYNVIVKKKFLSELSDLLLRINHVFALMLAILLFKLSCFRCHRSRFLSIAIDLFAAKSYIEEVTGDIS
jgi:hypothetical protein